MAPDTTMITRISRRTFLAGAGFAALGASPWISGVQFGYAAITWGQAEKQAVDDISSAGYAGIQFRIEAVTEFTPAELKALLAAHKLTFAALSSGQISLDAPVAQTLATHTANAKFVKDSGGLYLQILDQLKPYPRQVSPEECTRLGNLLTELGKRTADLGIPLIYHNHMNTISEHPDNLDRVMASSDPQYVKLLLDTAHSVAGGGDPVAEIAKYHDRIQYLHLKDVVDIPKDTPKTQYPFQFVELGRGRVDLPAVLRALEKVNYKGWAVVELDRVPVAGRTARESALISRKYLEQNWGAKFPAVS